MELRTNSGVAPWSFFTICPMLKKFTSMWQKFKEQLPAVVLTALLVIAGAFWVHQQTVSELSDKQRSQLIPLREQNDALKAASEENRRQIDATNKLLRDAISKREADLFRTDEEIQKLNVERMDALADAIAGVVGSVVSTVAFYPLDVHKTGRQAASPPLLAADARRRRCRHGEACQRPALSAGRGHPVLRRRTRRYRLASSWSYVCSQVIP